VIYAYNEYVIFVNRNYSETCNETGTEISIFLLEAVTKRLVYEGRFPFNGLTGQTRTFYLYQWEDLVYISQISRENGPHSNFI
jgi:hypothetical protein